MSSFRRWASAGAVAALAFVAASCSDAVTSPEAPGPQFSHSDLTGSGAPSGKHFNLNIIGVDKAKNDNTDDEWGGNGHRIFVALEGKTKILLSPGDDFEVLDANGTDGEASFQLPEDVATEYEVYVRPLGKPGGEAEITTCAEDPDTGDEVCSTLSTVQMRTKGKSSFVDVSKELLFIELEVGVNVVEGSDLEACLDEAGLLKGNGTATVPLFDPCLQGFFWDYDNKGLRLLQMRFYPVPA